MTLQTRETLLMERQTMYRNWRGWKPVLPLLPPSWITVRTRHNTLEDFSLQLQVAEKLKAHLTARDGVRLRFRERDPPFTLIFSTLFSRLVKPIPRWIVAFHWKFPLTLKVNRGLWCVSPSASVLDDSEEQVQGAICCELLLELSSNNRSKIKEG